MHVKTIKGILFYMIITVVWFTDFKKVFNTINQNLLMTKLERYGIRKVAYPWIKSCYKNR